MLKKIIVILIILIIIGGIFILIKNNYNLTKKNDSAGFIHDFSGWIVKVGSNMANTAGYVVKMDWLPK